MLIWLVMCLPALNEVKIVRINANGVYLDPFVINFDVYSSKLNQF